jgi:hypothetical protein
MRQLAVSAFDALDERDLTELMDQLHARVLARPSEELLDVELVGTVWEWRFKPFVELLFRHIVDVASDSELSTAERQREIIWAVEMVGF